MGNPLLVKNLLGWLKPESFIDPETSFALFDAIGKAHEDNQVVVMFRLPEKNQNELIAKIEGLIQAEK
jgi:hypothetical protein